MEITNHKNFRIKPLNGSAPEVLRQAHRIGAKWWLGGGTVLGMYRQNDFIPGDTDIDIEVEGYPGVGDDLRRTFKHMDLIRTVVHSGNIMQIAHTYKDVIFDIYVLWRDGDFMVNYNDCGTMQTPAKFYDDLAILETKYGDYPVPMPIEDYLVVRYGSDWKTPANHKGLYTHAI
jgi:hypothetical protein